MSKKKELNTKSLKPYSLLDFLAKLFAFVFAQCIYRKIINVTLQGWFFAFIVLICVFYIVMEVKMFMIVKGEKMRLIKKKQITVATYFKRVLIQGFFFFFTLIWWQICVYQENLYNGAPNNLFSLCLFFVVCILLIISYFEIRTLTPNEERFLGYKAYILYYYKYLSIPISVITTCIVLVFFQSIIELILIQGIWAILYNILILLFFKKYRTFIRENKAILFISYQIRIKKWYIEGSLSS